MPLADTAVVGAPAAAALPPPLPPGAGGGGGGSRCNGGGCGCGALPFNTPAKPSRQVEPELTATGHQFTPDQTQQRARRLQQNNRQLMKSIATMLRNFEDEDGDGDAEIEGEDAEYIAAAAHILSPEKQQVSAADLLQQASDTIVEQEKLIDSLKHAGKDAITSLVAQNRELMGLNGELKNQVKGLKWTISQMKGVMDQTSRLLKDNTATITKLRQTLAGKERLGDHRNRAGAAFAEGSGTGRLQPDNPGYDPKSSSEQTKKSLAARKAVSEILLAAEGSESKAVDIVQAILNHSTLKSALKQLETKNATGIDTEIVDELVKSLDLLKKGSTHSTEWHTYQSVLNAVVPAKYTRPQLMADRLEVTFRKVKKVAVRKTLIDASNDWGIGHTAKVRKDAWSEQHKEHIPTIEEWWANNSQPDPSQTKTKHNKTKHAHWIDQSIHRRICCRVMGVLGISIENLPNLNAAKSAKAPPADCGACEEHPVHYQVMTDKSAYQCFILAEPDIATVTPFNIFMKYKPWYISAPNHRTSLCVYHSNFKLMHEAYTKFVKGIHGIDCRCECEELCKGTEGGEKGGCSLRISHTSSL